MPRRVALASIRTVHTLIFGVILPCIGWLVWTGAAGRRDRTVGLAAGIVAAETAVWIANDRVCPLTPLAEHLGAERGSVSDIFLPDVGGADASDLVERSSRHRRSAPPPIRPALLPFGIHGRMTDPSD